LVARHEFSGSKGGRIMRLFIEPVEPLLFRSSRPFDAGENNFAESIFPPTPETLQGAIRATIAANWVSGKDIAEAFRDPKLVALIGNTTHYGRFRITGLSLGRYKKNTANQQIEGNSQKDAGVQQAERIFPMPTHILEEDGKNKRQAILLPEPDNNLKKGIVHTNLPEGMRLLYPRPRLDSIDGKVEPMRGWLTEHVLQRILGISEEPAGKILSDEEVIKESDIFVRESRLGIGMNNRTKTTEEGLLYQAEMIRMNHDYKSAYTYGFIVDVRLTTEPASQQLVDDKQTQNELHLPKSGWMILGGERRAAQFTIIDTNTSDESQPTPSKSHTLLYLATPAVFRRGWQPFNWQEFVSPTQKPIAVAMTRYQSIGGWQLDPNHAAGVNKTINRCVPAGTIYYFDQPVQLIKTFTESGAEIGYGITIGGGRKQ
jgi:CRISPR-associated protein Cmr3